MARFSWTLVHFWTAVMVGMVMHQGRPDVAVGSGFVYILLQTERLAANAQRAKARGEQGEGL